MSLMTLQDEVTQVRSISTAMAVGVFAVMMVLVTAAQAQPPALDETPAKDGEWGFRPADGDVATRTPAPFSWRPQKAAVSYALQVARDADFRDVVYQHDGITFNVHTPPRAFAPGELYWRFRATGKDDEASAWSTPRRFVIPDDAVKFPLPDRQTLLARVPREHPRLFLRPEHLPDLRAKAKGDLKAAYEQLIAEAEALLKKPTVTDEPPLYPKGTVRLSEEWREFWWGARRDTTRTLGPAAELGFIYRLSGDKRYGEEAKRILLAAAEWDPKGASGYRYNDEAGMPYAYLFSRTYSFVHDLLSEAERDKCRTVMRIRGEEMYDHLHPSHFWTPYKSHQNRAWHFLGEVAIAFHGEILEADDWLWFATNVFANTYPVWNDADGGWHEGLAYWLSYMNRFTWWADIMNAALQIDAYELPYFASIGYYPMYLQPPGTHVGGFGDQVQGIDSHDNVSLMRVFAAQAQNPYWQWYADAHGRPSTPGAGGYVEFIRAALYPPVEAKRPDDLATSRVFRGTGQAYLNSDLLHAKDNVAVLFKSSPFGTQSHGYDSQNAFQVYAFGRPLFMSTGVRDIYGSDHHKDWMWETESVNSILVGGKGQMKHSPKAVGVITAFKAFDGFDYVQGEAAKAYDPALKRFTRSILFVKPELIVILDQIESDTPQTFDWLLHTPTEMKINGQGDIRVTTETATAHVAFLAPSDLKVTQTDEFAPPPRERIKLTQYHLTASTKKPAKHAQFITVLRPHRPGANIPTEAKLEWQKNGYTLRAKLTDGEVIVNLRTTGTNPGDIDMSAIRYDAAGKVIGSFGDAVRQAASQ